MAGNILPTHHVQQSNTNKRSFADVLTSPDQTPTKRQALAFQLPPGHTDDSTLNMLQLDGHNTTSTSSTLLMENNSSTNHEREHIKRKWNFTDEELTPDLLRLELQMKP